MRTLERLSQLADNAALGLRPEFYVEFESDRPVREKILETANRLRANLIIMGLHRYYYGARSFSLRRSDLPPGSGNYI
jgi:hypothetical protein